MLIVSDEQIQWHILLLFVLVIYIPQIFGHYSVIRAFVTTKFANITSHNHLVYNLKKKLRQKYKRQVDQRAH